MFRSSGTRSYKRFLQTPAWSTRYDVSTPMLLLTLMAITLDRVSTDNSLDYTASNESSVTSTSSFNSSTDHMEQVSTLPPTVLCNHDQNLKCTGDFCDKSSNATCQLPNIENGVFQMPPVGDVVESCVGEGQVIVLLCNQGYEILHGSGMPSMEYKCSNGSLSLWNTQQLCVPIKCELPNDWLKFTDFTEKTTVEKSSTSLLSYPYKTIIAVKCWHPDFNQNWAYSLTCMADGWHGAEVLARTDCEIPHKEKELLAHDHIALAQIGYEKSEATLFLTDLKLIAYVLFLHISIPYMAGFV